MSPYKAVAGARISNKDAEVIGETVDRLQKKHGTVTAALLVREARRKGSPVARLFEWDKGKAFELYLLDRARYLLRSYTIIVEDVTGDNKPMTVRGVHVVESDEGRTYAPIDSIVKSADYTAQVVERALSDLIAWKHKYANLRRLSADFRPVFDAIDSVTAKKNETSAAE
jgi:hypothetical protein